MRRAWFAVGSFVVLIASVAAVASRPAAPRVAYVSLQRVFAQSTSATAAGKNIQQFREQRAKDIATKQKQIEDLRLKVAQSGGVFQASRRAEAQKEAARAVADLQKLEQDAQAQLQTMQRDAQREFQREVSAVVQELSQQRGADVVLNVDTAVVWMRPGADWTDDVLQAVNARHSK